ncbi:hypothetical protein ACA910_019651 [Epithemia clementina (nom. ined.)]
MKKRNRTNSNKNDSTSSQPPAPFNQESSISTPAPATTTRSPLAPQTTTTSTSSTRSRRGGGRSDPLPQPQVRQHPPAAALRRSGGSSSNKKKRNNNGSSSSSKQSWFVSLLVALRQCLVGLFLGRHKSHPNDDDEDNLFTTKKTWWQLGLDRTTWQGTVILLTTIATSLLWNNLPLLLVNNSSAASSLLVDVHVERLVQMAAAAAAGAQQQSANTASTTATNNASKLLQQQQQDASLFYHADLQTSYQRRQTAARSIPSRTTILRVPRQDLIWDWDALKNSFVQDELFAARRRRIFVVGVEREEKEEELIPLTADVFLAAHLARLIQKYKRRQNNVSDTTDEEDYWDDLGSDGSEFLQHYLTAVLPTYEDYVSFHPVFWNTTTPQIKLLRSSSMSAFDLVNSYKELLAENYEALCYVSSRFEEQVSRFEFYTALLHVWTRSFGTGPLSKYTEAAAQNEAAETDEQDHAGDDVDELKFIQKEAGVDLSQGSFSMVPILDLYNHHANPNVDFKYNQQEEAFVVKTIRALPVGQEVRDSYGKHSEAHLLAKYGFVNGDGSDHTQASLALFHPVYSRGLPPSLVPMDNYGEQEKLEAMQIEAQRLIKYLHNDDGYEQCIRSPLSLETGGEMDVTEMEAAFAFKILKLQHLMKIAHVPQRWMIFLTPRNPKARPPLNLTTENDDEEDEIPRFIPSQVQVDANPIMATCRLIAMTHLDYDRTATRLLRDSLSTSTSSDPFYPPPIKNGPLQFREIMCILRFCQISFQMYNTTVDQQERLVMELNQGKKKWKDDAQQTKQSIQDNTFSYHHDDDDDDDDLALDEWPHQEWMIAHVKLAELQALQVLRDNAMKWMHHFLLPEYDNPGELMNTAPEYTLRNSPCPWKYQMELIEHLLLVSSSSSSSNR